MQRRQKAYAYGRLTTSVKLLVYLNPLNVGLFYMYVNSKSLYDTGWMHRQAKQKMHCMHVNQWLIQMNHDLYPKNRKSL